MSAPAKLALFPRRTRLALRIVVVVVTAAVVGAVATVVVAVTAVVVVTGGGFVCVCVCGGIVYDYNIFHSILAGDS